MSNTAIAEAPVVHGSFVVERTYPVSPERVFAAFADPAKKRRWYADTRTHETIEFTMDFRVGGVDRGSFRFSEASQFPGVVFSNNTTYQDIEPNRRIVVAYTMAFGEKRISASLATFEFVPTASGTNLVFTEQAAFFEGSDGLQVREMGWTKLLESLGEELGR